MSTPTTPFYPMTHDDAQEIKTALQGIQGKAVKYEPQSLTAAEQAQARENISAACNSVADGIAIIAEGNYHNSIASGQYVYVRGHDTLTEGLYAAREAIPANDPLTTTNLRSVGSGNGGLNELKSSVDTLNSKFVNQFQTYHANVAAESDFTFTMPIGGHAFCGIANSMIKIFMTGGTDNPSMYVTDTPSGFEITHSGLTVTIHRTNGASFGVGIIVV